MRRFKLVVAHVFLTGLAIRNISVPELDGVISPYRPPRRVRAMIGEIVMSGAEIDHLISLALFKLSRIDFSIGFILLDRASIGTKIAKLRYLVSISSDIELNEQFLKLDAELTPFLKIRNTVAHGHLLGRQSNGAFAFLVTADYTDNLGEFCSAAEFTNEEHLSKTSKGGQRCIKLIEEIFDVRPLHETTQYKLLTEKPPTLKSQHKSNPSKSPRPPKSSRA